MPGWRRSTLTPLGVVWLTACASLMTPPEPSQPEYRTVEYRMPMFVPLPETRETQERGGVAISVAPVAYRLVRDTVELGEEIEDGFGDRLSFIRQMPSSESIENWRLMLVERTPRTHVEPAHLRFLVTVNNQMPRVFRGAGAVVQFNVGGRLQGVEQEGYADFLNAIVPPRSQQQLEVYGPELSILPDSTVVGLFLYDVVTRIDNAGDVTERQNFEWYFTHIAQVQQDRVQIERLKRWERR